MLSLALLTNAENLSGNHCLAHKTLKMDHYSVVQDDLFSFIF